MFNTGQLGLAPAKQIQVAPLNMAGALLGVRGEYPLTLSYPPSSSYLILDTVQATQPGCPATLFKSNKIIIIIIAPKCMFLISLAVLFSVCACGLCLLLRITCSQCIMVFHLSRTLEHVIKYLLVFVLDQNFKKHSFPFNEAKINFNCNLSSCSFFSCRKYLSPFLQN